MKKLFIIGAGAFGRELESWLEQSPECGRQWQIAGYLHSGDHTLSRDLSDYEVVGEWQTFPFESDHMVILGTSDSGWKKRIFEALRGEVPFMTYIHPSAIIGKFSRLGEGCVVCPNCIITTNVEIEDCVLLNCGTQIGHDVKIGAYSSLMSHVDLGGWSQVGKRVFMGTQSVVVPHKKIGDDCKITAGAIVMRHVKPGKTMFGNPAMEMD